MKIKILIMTIILAVFSVTTALASTWQIDKDHAEIRFEINHILTTTSGYFKNFKGDMVFDPFLGSGTSSVVAKKLERSYLGVELDKTFACLAEKRIKFADKEKSIQGYKDNLFWERNSSI